FRSWSCRKHDADKGGTVRGLIVVSLISCDSGGAGPSVFTDITAITQDPNELPEGINNQGLADRCSSEGPGNVAQETRPINVVDSLIEQVFLLTLDKEPFHERVPQCVYLEELHNELDKQTWIDTNTLHQAVFDRLTLDSPVDHVIVTSRQSASQSAQDVAQPDPLCYLFQCYSRLIKQTPVKPDLRDVCQSAIISSAKLSFQHPELFPTLDIPDQFMSIFTDSPDVATDFFHQVAEAIDGEKEKTLFDCFQPILDSLKASVEEDRSLSRSSGVFQCLDVVLFFAQHNLLAKVLIKYNEPPAGSPGRAYEDTLLGAVLSISCVPQSEAGPYEFFDQPSQSLKQEHDFTETYIHLTMGLLTERMHQVFYSLLSHKGDSCHRTLCWLGQCLQTNKGG
ncbi:Ubiquitin conjugation factor E4 A, partial [Lamellibrachia satsuma]